MAGKGMVCKCPHHKAVPALIVSIGVDLLLGAVGVLTAGVCGHHMAILLILSDVLRWPVCLATK